MCFIILALLKFQSLHQAYILQVILIAMLVIRNFNYIFTFTLIQFYQRRLIAQISLLNFNYINDLNMPIVLNMVNDSKHMQTQMMTILRNTFNFVGFSIQTIFTVFNLILNCLANVQINLNLFPLDQMIEKQGQRHSVNHLKCNDKTSKIKRSNKFIQNPQKRSQLGPINDKIIDDCKLQNKQHGSTNLSKRDQNRSEFYSNMKKTQSFIIDSRKAVHSQNKYTEIKRKKFKNAIYEPYQIELKNNSPKGSKQRQKIQLKQQKHAIQKIKRQYGNKVPQQSRNQSSLASKQCLSEQQSKLLRLDGQRLQSIFLQQNKNICDDKANKMESVYSRNQVKKSGANANKTKKTLNAKDKNISFNRLNQENPQYIRSNQRYVTEYQNYQNNRPHVYNKNCSNSFNNNHHYFGGNPYFQVNYVSKNQHNYNQYNYQQNHHHFNQYRNFPMDFQHCNHNNYKTTVNSWQYNMSNHSCNASNSWCDINNYEHSDKQMYHQRDRDWMYHEEYKTVQNPSNKCVLQTQQLDGQKTRAKRKLNEQYSQTSYCGITNKSLMQKSFQKQTNQKIVNPIRINSKIVSDNGKSLVTQPKQAKSKKISY